jgi:hypothetical protein
MIDGPSRDHLPDDLGWDQLRSTSEALADPGEHLYRSLGGAGDRFDALPALPAGELLGRAKRLWSDRGVRDRVFGGDLCPNPTWNILLDLFIAGEEGRNVTIKSACSAAGVPQSTALRHIAHLIEVRLTARAQHPSDARSAYLRLTDRGRTRMVAFLTLSASDPAEPGA